MKRKKILILGLALLLVLVCAACGEKYTCSMCGKEVSEAYYNPFDTDEYFCEDCAKGYFAPLPYTNYKVQ